MTDTVRGQAGNWQPNTTEHKPHVQPKLRSVFFSQHLDAIATFANCFLIATLIRCPLRNSKGHLINVGVYLMSACHNTAEMFGLRTNNLLILDLSLLSN